MTLFITTYKLENQLHLKLGFQLLSSHSSPATQGSFFFSNFGLQITWNRIILGEEALLIKFHILKLYPRSTDSASKGWDLGNCAVKQEPRLILYALGFEKQWFSNHTTFFQGHCHICVLNFWDFDCLSGMGHCQYTSLKIPVWNLIHWPQILSPPQPTMQDIFPRLAWRKNQSLFSFWLIGDSLATNISLCAFLFYSTWAGLQGSWCGGWLGWGPEKNN